MIAFLLANRWAAELAGIVILLGSFYGWLKVHDASERKQGETACEARLTETRAQAQELQDKKVQAYDEQMHEAQVEHDRELASLRVGHDPIIVHDGAVCASPVHHPAPAPDRPPEIRPVVSGTGGDIDIRPAINDFERRYEVALADCRQALADWPH